jgi:hypothetical protein
MISRLGFTLTCIIQQDRSRPANAASGIVHRSPRRTEMTPAQEQMMLTNLTAISQDIKVLLELIKELTQQEAAAEEKAYNQLVHIAHKR